LEDMQKSKVDSGKSLQLKIAQVNKLLRKLDEKLTSLDTEVDKIHSNVKEHKVLISKRIQTAKRKAVVAHQAKKEYAASKTRYYIQALVPGRAWIKSKKGSTITVRKGSRVSTYGVVREIDVLNGRILTTSGRVIRFHPSER